VPVAAVDETLERLVDPVPAEIELTLVREVEALGLALNVTLDALTDVTEDDGEAVVWVGRVGVADGSVVLLQKVQFRSLLSSQSSPASMMLLPHLARIIRSEQVVAFTKPPAKKTARGEAVALTWLMATGNESFQRITVMVRVSMISTVEYRVCALKKPPGT